MGLIAFCTSYLKERREPLNAREDLDSLPVYCPHCEEEGRRSKVVKTGWLIRCICCQQAVSPHIYEIRSNNNRINKRLIESCIYCDVELNFNNASLSAQEPVCHDCFGNNQADPRDELYFERGDVHHDQPMN
jgi:hypothetical protein